jgi:hypothetical protein
MSKNQTAPMPVRMPTSLLERLEAKAALVGLSRNAAVIEAIEEWLGEQVLHQGPPQVAVRPKPATKATQVPKSAIGRPRAAYGSRLKKG